MNLRLRLVAAVGMTVVCFAALGLHQAFGTSWSNHCDPGNTQFNLLKHDPVVTSHLNGGLMIWENDGQDNSWLCSGPSLSLSYIGPNRSSLMAQANAAMISSGWKLIPMGNVDMGGWSPYEKQTPGGVHLDAFVRPQPLWVEIDMTAPGLHMGDQGFQ